MNKDNDNSSRAKKNLLDAFFQILIESKIPYLPTIVKCIQLFPKKYVIVFLIGVLSIWLYSLVFPLPLYNILSKQNGILLYGNVKIKEEEGVIKPFKNEFQVGVLSGRRQGPFNDTEEADGSFSLEVPLLKKYNIVVWDEQFSNFRYFGDKDVQRVDGKYEFQHDLIIFN